MKIVVAPDKFKGSLPATQVAAAIAAGLRSGDAELVTIPVADGMNAPPPRAWMNRASSSSSMLGARPQQSDESVKTAADIMKTFLRPYMSLILPAIGMAMTWPSA